MRADNGHSQRTAPAVQAGFNRAPDLSGGERALGEIYAGIARNIRDPAGHALAGIAYHHQFLAGDLDAFVLAETAYSVAVRISDGKPSYKYLLGLLYLDAERYADAQSTLLSALEPGTRAGNLLENVAYAAWEAGDSATSLWTIERIAEEEELPPRLQAAAALAAAASGDTAKAHAYRDAYLRSGGRDTRRFADLVAAWLLVADRRASRGNRGALLVQAQGGSATTGPGQASGAEIAEPTAWYDCKQRVTPAAPFTTPGGFSGISDREYQEFLRFIKPLEALPAPCRDRKLPKTAMAEVTFIKTFSAKGKNFGVNLLQNLQVVFNFSKDRWQRRRGESSGGAGETVSTMSERLLAGSIGTPVAGIRYALNIAGATEETARIDSRPTVALLDRFPSTFFSGALITLGQEGQYGSSFKEKPVGIAINITPTFLNNDDILLAVKVAGSDFAEQAFVPGTFDESLIVLHETLMTYTRVRLGETIVISELAEKINDRSVNKVPVLGDIPVLNAFFKKSNKEEIRENITILITLHKDVINPLTATSDGSESVTRRQEMHPLLRSELEAYLRKTGPEGAAQLPLATDEPAVKRLYASTEDFFYRPPELADLTAMVGLLQEIR